MAWHSPEEEFDERAQRLAARDRKLETLRRQGEDLEPLACKRRSGLPAESFWGKAWCRNLESYSDFEDRMPRGRTYLRKGTVLGLRIDPGEIFAYVTGSDLYEVFLRIDPLPAEDWQDFQAACASEIGSLLDLLGGKLGPDVLSRITDQDAGLFPSPRELHLTCTCPDYADMCKHVAAVLYGVGVRLDEDPELFFHLRQVDHRELLAGAGRAASTLTGASSPPADPASLEVLRGKDLSELFGVEISEPETAFGRL